MRILVATGGSPHSGVALRFSAESLPVSRDSELFTLLTVIRQADERPRGEEILARASERVRGAVPQVQTRIRIGHPAEEIIREAEEGAYDLVIVGERQHHDLVTRFLLGSTAERVVEHAPCPVIIAKGKIDPVQRILLCDSGVEDGTLLTRFMAQLVELLERAEETTILHVMSQITAGPGVRGGQLRASAEELIEEHTPEGDLLARDVQLLERLKIHPVPKVRHGLVVDEIVAEAQAGDYQLVVIGAHRGEGWRNILLDDLARQIIVQMDRPVLVVR